jgi:Flp pilus assembly protein TadG
MDQMRGCRPESVDDAVSVAGRRRRCQDDCGAALVEAAIITPVFFLLALGLIEYGLVFRDYIAIGNATSSGTRSLAILGEDDETDYWVLQAIKKDMSAVPTNSIQKIAIFKATGATDTTSWSSCKTGGSITNVCNVYTPADWNKTPITTWFGCGPGRLDNAWCPTTRKVAITGTLGPPDFAGVYIRVQHNYVTKLFGNSVTLDNFVISRLEPKRVT